MKHFLILLLSTIFFTSCCACRKGSPKIGELESAKWSLIDFQNKAVDNSGIVLTFSANEKMIYGEAPCNNFFASYSVEKGDKNNIKIGVTGATRKACPEMELEMQFTQLLSTITTVQMEGDNMLMLNSEGALIAICKKVE